ncbi:MAG: AI-2E family transporter [Deltaproteobacteria bacterium]|jgi:predicted PurR-regulated permease PerM|nr:AI-2E family transporter [Deltaproteobacteria bacterium]
MTEENMAHVARRPAGAGLFLGLGAVLMLAVMLLHLKIIFLPMILAFFLCCLLNPLVGVFRRWGLPRPAAVICTLALGLAVMWLLCNYVLSSLTAFRDGFPRYEGRFEALLERLNELRLNRLSFVTLDMMQTQLSKLSMGSLLSGFFNSLMSFAGYLLLTALFILYFLPALPALPDKLKKAFPGPRGETLSRGAAAVSAKIQSYILIKAVLSAILGLIVTLTCLGFGVDFAASWGIFAFFLNFVPTLGAPLAVAPPVLLCLVQHGWSRAAWLAAVLGAAELVYGNWVEPIFLGRSVNLSPTAAILSILLWGWLWGGVGMVIAVPATAVIKLTCDGLPALQPAGSLMGR